jgi:eukaryotic-like serine/threonine-protein kinase
MRAFQRRCFSEHLGSLAMLLCLAVLVGCGSDTTKPSSEYNCYPQSGPIPGPVVFHPTKGQAGLYAYSGSGIYRYSSVGGVLTPVWLYRLHGCAGETPTPEEHVAGPSYDDPFIRSDVTVAGGMVYFGASETTGNWVDLYAVHADTGALAWKVRVTNLSGLWGIQVFHDLVYAEAGDPSRDAGSFDMIQAFSVRDGAVRWTYRYPFGPFQNLPSMSSVGDGKIYGSGPNEVYALDATTGKKAWDANLAPDQSAPLASLFDGVVYVTASAGCDNCVAQPASSLVYALDPATGTRLWQSQWFDGYLTPPMESHGIVYVGSQDGHLHALSVSDGKQLWVSAAGGELSVTPQVMNGLVYVCTGIFQGTANPNTTTHLLAFDATTGQQRWSYTFPPNQADGSEPLLAGNGLIFTISGDQYIDVLQASTGMLLHQDSFLLTGYSYGLTLAV